MKAVEFARAFVRPYISYLIITGLVVLGIKLAMQYADADLAKIVIIFILGSGITIMGFWFGERKAKKPE